MNSAVSNIQCRPVPFLWVGDATGMGIPPGTDGFTDDDGVIFTDDDGAVLTDD